MSSDIEGVEHTAQLLSECKSGALRHYHTNHGGTVNNKYWHNRYDITHIINCQRMMYP